jgi:hypothetical protein
VVGTYGSSNFGCNRIAVDTGSLLYTTDDTYVSMVQAGKDFVDSTMNIPS